MSLITIVIGAVLGLLGLGSYAQSPSKHPSALFPTLLGGLLIAFGVVGQKSAKAQPTAAALASSASLVGLLVSLQGLLFPQLFTATAEHPEEHRARQIVQASTAALCATEVGLALASAVKEHRPS